VSSGPGQQGRARKQQNRHQQTKRQRLQGVTMLDLKDMGRMIDGLIAEHTGRSDEE